MKLFAIILTLSLSLLFSLPFAPSANAGGIHFNFGHLKHYYKHTKLHSKKHHNSHHNRDHHGFSYGQYGRYHRGVPWCPIHLVYHVDVVTHHDNWGHNKEDRQIEERYVEEIDGVCYRITEYDNGDELRKRIRSRHCDSDDSDDSDEKN